MLVKEIMTRNVVAIGPDTPIRDVQALMEQRNIRHFPILEGRSGGAGSDHLLGIVSDRDLRLVGADHPKAPKGVTASHPVRDVMVPEVLVAHPEDPVEETAKVLRDNKIGAMPVMDDGRLVGIVTGIDMLDALVRMSGVKGASSRLEVELVDRPGALAGLLDRVASRNINVSSVLTARADEASVTFVLRVGTLDGHGLAAHLRGLGYNVLWPPETTEA
ncbi:MAG: CBS and ACT domain-containing protein [Trueperaceae bacterium]|jgi:acetoin utilization protein AcuB|nr:CBS and ACT domain-containing protein [Truepera sp.]HRN17702.1 CBS and ACT domain-containing protein [Trueperaceae bacterium]HRQ10223.1 CBS and ACT domain-containing protein [Trueperaceae bacterium]